MNVKRTVALVFRPNVNVVPIGTPGRLARPDSRHLAWDSRSRVSFGPRTAPLPEPDPPEADHPPGEPPDPGDEEGHPMVAA